MYHIFFIHSSVDGHLGCFHVLATVNSVKAADFKCLSVNRLQWFTVKGLVSDLCLVTLLEVRTLPTSLFTGVRTLHRSQDSPHLTGNGQSWKPQERLEPAAATLNWRSSGSSLLPTFAGNPPFLPCSPCFL